MPWSAAGERQLDPALASPRGLGAGSGHRACRKTPGSAAALFGPGAAADQRRDAGLAPRRPTLAAGRGNGLRRASNQQYGDAEACHEALRLIRPRPARPARARRPLPAGSGGDLSATSSRTSALPTLAGACWRRVAPLGGPVTLASVIEHTGRSPRGCDRARARALLERQLETAARSPLAARCRPPHRGLRDPRPRLQAPRCNAAELAERWLEVARQAPDEPQAPVNREAILVDLLEQAARASLALGENGLAARTAAEARDPWSEGAGWTAGRRGG